MDKFNLPWLLVLLVVFTFSDVCAFPEKGKWTYDINQDTKFIGVFKSLFSNSTISFNIHGCKSDQPAQLSVSWSLRHSPCWQEYIGLENVETGTGNLQSYFYTPDARREGLNYTSPVEFVRSEEMSFPCDSEHPIIMPAVLSPMTRTGRAVVSGSPQYLVTKEGVYLFIVQIKQNSVPFTAQTTIEMKSDHGYLSAVDWPLLPFYATMCALYSIMGALWLVICLCRWRDILRIQMWIGAVLFLGMLEMAVYLAEYESLNKTGELTVAAEYTAELLSCAKRSLARILVLIASMGFGIVKPRLGATLQKIVGAGIFYMVLSAVESYLKLVQPKNNGSKNIYAASLILALMDAALCFWIFSSLVATVRTLRLRRNTVKLALYNHFTNTLIFAVVASLIFMLWSIYFHQMATCLTDWKELWLDEAFWKLLFSLLLMVIMVLWRPTNNNQRYAFTPLLDSGDETDEDDVVVHDNLVGMKMRMTRSNTDASPKPSSSNSIEDDLKWVEEHIPSSVAEAGAPLLDSEEEIMTTRFELSKMQ